MRAPHEALGHVATEIAMDELAYAVGVDPVALRLLNDTLVDPYTGRPFSTRAMRRCLTEGAERFGWNARNPVPRSMRDGRYLIGQGVAGAIYTHWRWPSKARVVLRSDGSALVESGMQEIGCGTYNRVHEAGGGRCSRTSSADKVDVHLGDTRLPASHSAIGSTTPCRMPERECSWPQTPRGTRRLRWYSHGRDAPFAGAIGQRMCSL